MKNHPGNLPAFPFFLKAERGERFCIYHHPNSANGCRGAFIYIHPFAEEMNKSRHMAALQSRALADMGYAVLQIDLLGCGDSSGDFADASWEAWIDDLAAAEKWLSARISAGINLWGLRLGANLALDFARRTQGNIDSVILWQPVINTAAFLTQFLRLRLANEIITNEKKINSGSQSMLNELAMGKAIEIAGYELAPAMAHALNTLNTCELTLKSCPVRWFEVVSEARLALNPAAKNLLHCWKQQGGDVRGYLVPGVPFWATAEISVCSALISAMAHHLAKASR